MGPHFSQVGGVGLIPDRRTKIPLAMWCGQKKGGGDRDGSLRQRLEGRRHKLRDTRGPQRLQEAGKALRRARGPVSPDHTLISGCQDRANECWSKSARVQSPAAQPRPLTQGVSGRGPRAPHSICTDLCAVRGPPWVPRGSPVSPGLWDGWHPARVWPAPSRGSTEMSREEQAGCCPHHRRPPCESSLSGPALTPCPRPLASTSSQMQWALRHPTPPLRRPPAQPQSRGTPVGFPGSHTSPDLISWPVSLWDDWGVSGRPVSGVQWAESGRGAGIGSPFLAWGEWLELLQPQSPHL